MLTMLLFTQLVALVAFNPAEARPVKVGELKDVSAWIDRMPLGPPRLHIAGKITAPGSCYQVIVSHTGNTNPFVYSIKISTYARRRHCLQKAVDLAFHYEQKSSASHPVTAHVFSEMDAKDVNITVVY